MTVTLLERIQGRSASKAGPAPQASTIDEFGRAVTYQRVSRPERWVDLREVLPASNDPANLAAAINNTIDRKQMDHDLIIDRNSRLALSRDMSVTGG